MILSEVIQTQKEKKICSPKSADLSLQCTDQTVMINLTNQDSSGPLKRIRIHENRAGFFFPL